jgi:hypothetical protein
MVGLRNAGVYILAIPPPLEGGGKKRHFLDFGEENRPLQRKKISEVKKILVLLENLFSIKTLALKEILKSINFLTGEE